MRRAFFIVGPTATGKSELGADVAREVNAEIISADAFQIYCGLDLLTAKPDASTLANAPHHLIGTVPFTEAMNAEKFRRLGLRAIEEINAHGRGDECDRVADDRFVRNPGTARWKKITSTVYRRNSAGDSPLRQETVDLVSATK